MSDSAVSQTVEVAVDQGVGDGAAAGGLSANALKLIAIVAMLIDHIAHVFLPYDGVLYNVMRFIGRITGPVMFFMVAQGYRLTGNKNRYMLRLLAFAAISYLPFIYMSSGLLPNADTWLALNVIWTIFIGLVAIRVRNELHNPVLKVALLLLLAYPASLGDWGVTGYLIMLCFDYFYGNFKQQAVVYCGLVFTYGGILQLMLYPTYGFLYGIEIDLSLLAYSVYSLGMFLPIILLYFYNGHKGRGGKIAKWSFYIFYPLHMLVLGLIRQFMTGGVS